MSNDDPFGDYDLEDEPESPKVTPKTTSKKKSKPKKSKQASTDAAPVKDYEQQVKKPALSVQFPAYAFKYQEKFKGDKACSQCHHYIDNAGLAVEQIYELKEPEFYQLTQQLTEFEEGIGTHEVREVVQKIKLLDDAFTEEPRLRSFCGANLKSRQYLIPEIKNYDGNCEDFLPGSRPFVMCSECTHHRSARHTKPYQSDYTSEMPSAFYDPDMGMSAIESYKRIRSIEEGQYQQGLQEYNYNLQRDVSDAITYNKMPTYDTIDQCGDNYRACAVVNRGHGCYRYQDKDHEKRFEPVKLLLDHYERESNESQVIDQQSKVKEPLCLSCQHMRVPVKVNPFEKSKVNQLNIMDIMNEYNREQQHAAREESQYMEGAGNYLGRNVPPVDTGWCDAYSNKHHDHIVEYAYCYRALHQGGDAGSCPQYKKK